MSFATFLALLVFSFVTSITPGPNNIMLLSSGVLYGIRKTLPHILGIGFGFACLLIGVGLGVGILIELYPPLFLALKISGGLYMLYLAYRIATATPTVGSNESARPMYFYEAALFQWVNVKAWIMAIVAISAYTSEGSYVVNVAIVTITFCLVNMPSVSFWAGFGVLLRQFLADKKKLRIFNFVQAFLLVLSLLPILTASI